MPKPVQNLTEAKGEHLPKNRVNVIFFLFYLLFTTNKQFPSNITYAHINSHTTIIYVLQVGNSNLMSNQEGNHSLSK